MTTANYSPRFVIDTFTETRGDRRYRAFHPVGNISDWVTRRNTYSERRLLGQGATGRPYSRFSGGIPLRFAVPLDQFLVLAHPDILVRGRIRFSFPWIGLNPPNSDDTIWLPLDTDHIRIRSHHQIPADHLRTEPYAVRGFVNGRPSDRILATLQAEYGIPD